MIARIEAVRAGLGAAGVDAFVSFFPATNQYLSGFEGTTSCILITHAEALFLCDFRYTEKAQGCVTGYTVKEVSGNLTLRAAEHLNEVGARRAGFEPANLSVADYDAVRGVFSGVLAGTPGLVSNLRIVKSPEEIARIRQASELAETVLDDVIGELEAGISERELGAEIEYELKARGADGASFNPIVAFGPNSSLPHSQPGEKRLARGDVVLLDFGCRKAGYCSDLTRTFAFGTISGDWFDTIYECTRLAQEAALAACRPGLTCAQLDAVARDRIAEAGFGPSFGHGLGHGVGVEIHEAPRINKESTTVLEAGMVITVEPGIYLAGRGGVRIEDLVVVTDSGCDVLTKSSKNLRIL